MIYIEALMVSVMIYVGILSSYTDIKYGIIKNRLLIIATIIATVLDIIYYCFFAKGFVGNFIINTFALTVFSILMYVYHIWSAGDSKMLITEILLLPAEIYSSMNGLCVSSVSIIILIFSIAYIYIIAETIYRGLKNGDLFQGISKIRLNKYNLVIFAKQYIQCSLYITLLNMIYVLVIPDIYINNIIFFMLINLFFVLTIFKYKIFYKSYIFAIALIAMIILAAVLKFNIIYSFNYKVYILLLFIIAFRKISEKYNYIEIPTESVKPGMILSLGTIMQFKKSRAKGLPQNTTEDMRSRISGDEANSIIRWGKSKYGEDCIVIVKKMPFAIFIILGIISYILMRMWIG